MHFLRFFLASDPVSKKEGFGSKKKAPILRKRLRLKIFRGFQVKKVRGDQTNPVPRSPC